MPNLQEYLSVIKLILSKKHPESTYDLLRQLVAAHLQTFAYQNTDLFEQGLKPREDREACAIDIGSVFTQMVKEGRPGYCFQNTELLAWALTLLGYNVVKHLVKIINVADEKLSEINRDDIPFGHVLLVVEAEGRKWIVDTGFANNSFREPLALVEGEQKIGPDNYRVSFHSDFIRFELKTPQYWFCLYECEKHPASSDDVNKAHQNMFKGVKTPEIFSFLKLAKVTPLKRKELVAKADTVFFRSTSAANKKYELVLMSLQVPISRHTIAVNPIIDGALCYEVLAPDCPKIRKLTIKAEIRLCDFEKIMSKERALELWETLEEKVDDVFLKALAPVLPDILHITALRGHTHKRKRAIVNAEEFVAIAREKLGIDCSLATRFSMFSRPPQLKDVSYVDFERQLGSDAKLGIHYMVLNKDKTVLASDEYRSNESMLMVGAVKIALALCVLYNVFDRKSFSLETVVEITDEEFSPGAPCNPLDQYYSIFEAKRTEQSVESLLTMMLEKGDNTSTDKLFQLVGGPGEVNKLMDQLELKGFSARYNSKEFLDGYYQCGDKFSIQDKVAYLNRVVNAYDLKDTEKKMLSENEGVSTPDFMTKLLCSLVNPPKALPWMLKASEFILAKIKRCQTGEALIFNSAYYNYGTLITAIGNNNAGMGGSLNDLACIELKDGRTILLSIMSSLSTIADKEQRDAIIGRLTTCILNKILAPQPEEHQHPSVGCSL
jgi:arylamine N-acetyltransferase/beta-lactamase class A